MKKLKLIESKEHSSEIDEKFHQLNIINVAMLSIEELLIW